MRFKTAPCTFGFSDQWSTVDTNTDKTVAVCPTLDWARFVTRALNQCAGLIPEDLDEDEE